MKILKLFPGIILSAFIAAFAMWIESLLPVHLIGSAVIAMFIGMFLNRFIKSTKIFAGGIKFTSKKLLKFAIILLGLSLNITTVLQVGKMSLTVMIFTLLTCFGGGYFIGRALKLNWKLSNLISAGTGICGGSAIAAISSVIDADDDDVAYAMSATFLFDMAMIVLFPIMGSALGMTDQAFGAQTTDVLKKGTVFFGTLFMVLCFVLAVLMNRQFQMKKSDLATGAQPAAVATPQQPEQPTPAPTINLEQFDTTAKPAEAPAMEPAATEPTPAQ